MSQIDPVYTSNRSLQGQVYQITNADVLKEALAMAFDYRGDCTVEYADGSTVFGYLYKYDTESFGIFVAEGKNSTPQNFPTAGITRIVLSGEDTAWGKSWEDWAHKNSQQRQQEAEALRIQAEKQGFL